MVCFKGILHVSKAFYMFQWFWNACVPAKIPPYHLIRQVSGWVSACKKNFSCPISVWQLLTIMFWLHFPLAKIWFYQMQLKIQCLSKFLGCLTLIYSTIVFSLTKLCTKNKHARQSSARSSNWYFWSFAVDTLHLSLGSLCFMALVSLCWTSRNTSSAHNCRPALVLKQWWPFCNSKEIWGERLLCQATWATLIYTETQCVKPELVKMFPFW